jgi:hypothetical protein
MSGRSRSSFNLVLALAAVAALGACSGGNNRTDTATAGGAVTDTAAMGAGGTAGTGTDTSGMAGRQGTGTDTSRTDTSRARRP